MISKTPQKNMSRDVATSLAASSVAMSAAASAVMGDAAVGDSSLNSLTSAFNSAAYHELLENPHVELDGLQRLKENLAQLEDLHGRMRFMMRDISGLIRRR